ncbi:DUF3953 domain-containing protein [Virgibacillus sp. FSP13]
MLKVIKIILGIAVIILSGYSLITQDFTFIPYMVLFLGLFMIVTGISEFQRKQKFNALITIPASLFILFVFIYTV